MQYVDEIKVYAANFADQDGLFKLSTRMDVTLGAGAAYIASVLLYKALFEPDPSAAKSKGKKKRNPLIKPFAVLHNLLLAVISIAMFVGFTSGIYKKCTELGLATCMDLHQGGATPVEDWWAAGPLAFWMMIFCVSKYYEFVDTYVMMAKGYNLIVLHWWHHASVPVLCAVHFLEQSSVAWTGSAFNAFVHSFMYSYYAWVAMGFKFPAKPLITALQLLQFCTVLGHTGYLHYVHGFDRFPLTFTMAYTVYSSYLILFINFFIQTYVNKPSKKKKLN